jgi:SPX domain protein involved in polyphosphate accumulation
MEKVVNNKYRFERKIIVNSHTYEDLIFLFKSKGFSQLYPERNICNIYLDDLNNHAYIDNINGNYKRLKHRIRWYGELFGLVTQISLEQKIKRGNVGIKNHFKIKKEFEFSSFYNHSQLTKLVRSLLSNLKNKILVDLMYPASINTYTRSYYGDILSRFRITFDKNIKYYSFQNKIKLQKTDERIIVEIKYDNENDIYANELLNFLNFRIGKNSKYVNGLESVKF